MSATTTLHEHAVEIDTLLKATHQELATVNFYIERAENEIRRATGQTHNGYWNGTLEDALAVNAFRSQWDAKNHSEGIAKRNELLPKRDELRVIIKACNDDWKANGFWSRFYLVCNSNGHIHSSTNCNTCFITTDYAWLTDLSGLTEADAVNAEGEVLCSVCFPSAPVSWTNGERRRDKEAKAKREAEKAERQRIKAEKSLSINGDPVEIRSDRSTTASSTRKEFKTLRSAELWLVEAYTYVLRNVENENHRWAFAPDAFSEENHAIVLDLYLKKTGKAFDDVVPNFIAKAEKKLKAL